MAAIDGIKSKIHPTAEGFGPYDINVYDLDDEQRSRIKSLPKSLEEAADSLEKDYAFLLEGGVFTEGIIKDQLMRIREEALSIGIIPHPAEYQLYYDL